MKTNTRENILQLLADKGPSRVKDLVSYLGLSSVAVHKQLKQLLNKEKIIRKGSPPVVYYALPPELIRERRHFPKDHSTQFIKVIFIVFLSLAEHA